MASVYDLKPKFQALLRPTTHWLARMGVSANAVTALALIISIALGAVIYLYPTRRATALAIPIWMFLRMALNAIDGMLAREHAMKSSLGAILNELGDAVSDAALFLPMGLMPLLNPILTTSIVVLALISEMAGVVPLQIGGTRHYEGPMGKSDRAFVMGLIALLIGFNCATAMVLNTICWVVIALSIITIFNRSSKALKEVERKNDE